jgi:uncharacterized membrane protein YphA (DoxX/SURF4 family)
MKTFVNIIRVLVGVLFIFSGLVKGNDPMGTAYKMEEYFEVWTADLASSSFFLKGVLTGFFHFMNEHSLFLAIAMNAFEIIAGAALLLGWRMKLFSWLLLILMIFFTILTGYTYKTGRPTNCGCFGDCLKITSEFSFYKDIVLTVLILLLLFLRKHIKPLFSPWANTALMILSIIFSFGLQWYALKYLPPVDCLPFKKGNRIADKMKLPANAIPDSMQMTFVYDKAGQKIEFTADKFPDDFNDSIYKFVSRYDKLIRKGKNNEPPIKGFGLSGTTKTDSTNIILEMAYSVILFEERPVTDNAGWKNEWSEIQKTLKQKNIAFFIATSSIEEYQLKKATDIPVLSCDFTAIRTAARANPTIYLLKSGRVEGKWSYADFDKALDKLKSL